jgi:hypothetical protein
LLVASGDTIDGVTLTSVSAPAINNNGDVVFRGILSPTASAIFTPTSLLAAPGDIIGGVTLLGDLLGFSFTINDDGNVAFTSTFNSFAGIKGGIFTLTDLMAATGDTIDSRTLDTAFSPVIKNNGDVVFVGSPSFSSGNEIYLAFKPETGSTLSCGPNTFESGGECLPVASLAFCGDKTNNVAGFCVPDFNQICGSGTMIENMMCVAQSMGTMIGGTLLEIDNYALFVAAIGTNPVITGLVGITIAGLTGQAVWFLFRRKKSEEKPHF